jgi:hypothetical protein
MISTKINLAHIHFPFSSMKSQHASWQMQSQGVYDQWPKGWSGKGTIRQQQME